MKTKIQIKSVIGTVLFEYESENNTIKKTVEQANLSRADLSGADLFRADLSGANLSGTYLFRADLSGANLSGAKNADYAFAQTLIVPDGSFIAWKKCCDNIIAKLQIPEDAKRHNASGRKCRAEKAIVLELIDLNDKHKKPTEAFSRRDKKTIYRVGETVVCDKWDENRWNECSGGVHFFITRIEAENYND
jgi:hypothetical protein